MKSNRRGSSNLAFNDLLFNVLIGFVMLFIIAFLLINPISKQGDIPSKAEYLITVNWPDESADDIDLWVQLGNSNPVGFSNKQQAPLHLDRDDLGTSNDIIEVDGVRKLIRVNTETITIRGEYTGDVHVAVHGYGVRNDPVRRNVELPMPVTVVVTKVNPYRIIYKETVYIQNQGHIINLPGFTINDDGFVTGLFQYNGKIVPRASRPGEQ